jgi:adenylate cyclase
MTSILLRVGIANFVAAVVVFAYQNFVAPNETGLSENDTRRAVRVFMGFAAVVFPLGAVIIQKLLRPAGRWVDERRPATDGEQRAMVRVPAVVAQVSISIWVVAVLFFGTVNIVLGTTPLDVARDAVGTVLGGLTASMLTYLLVERRVRPLLAQALRGQAPPPAPVPGVASRLLLAWALGSGVPLLGIATAQLRISGDDPAASRVGILFLSLLGLASGALLLAITARSVADPLRQVRSGLARVQAGDVSVELPVDDAGEVGLLEAGFNQMVAGLRERQELADLFGRHVGTEVAREALRQGVGLGGEKREATALFVDITASTAIAEEQDPAEVVDLLNRFFSAVVRTVAAEGGWVNKFEGDGALCIFGAPASQPDHAARALRAGCALRQALTELRERHPEFDAGIGISSGPVVAGNVGAEERYEYTVIGDPVNEAARITEVAKTRPSRLLASERTIQEAGDDAAGWVLVEQLSLRGRSRPTCAYAPREAVTSQPAEPSRTPSEVS